MVSLCVCQSAPVCALVVPVCCERGLCFKNSFLRGLLLNSTALWSMEAQLCTDVAVELLKHSILGSGDFALSNAVGACKTLGQRTRLSLIHI